MSTTPKEKPINKMNMRRLLEILESNPDCFIYYSDQNKFIVYKERPISQREEYLQSITLVSGDDIQLGRGQVPALVVALATMIGIDVGSI